MAARVSNENLMPLYRRVSEQLSKAILNAQFADGKALPSESDLCAQFGVSRITIRKALDELSEQGLITRRRGVGTFVNEADGSAWSITLTGVIEDVISPTQMMIHGEDAGSPPADVLRFAKLAPGARLRRYEGTNYIEPGKPLLHVYYYFPERVAKHMSVEALSGPVQAVKLVQKSLGILVSHAEQLVVPVNSTKTIADRLQLAPGTAVLRAIRVYYDADDRPIEIFEAFYHPTHYRFTATLFPRSDRRRASSSSSLGRVRQR
jgi:GntR family transcriptional regulator